MLQPEAAAAGRTVLEFEADRRMVRDESASALAADIRG